MSDLKSRVADLSREKKALLAQRLQQVRGESNRTSIPARPATLERIPLSSAQERVWFEHQWDSDSPLYTESVLLRMSGPFDESAWNRALNDVVKRHEALRTLFKEDESGVFQVISAPVEVRIPLTDLSFIPESAREGEMVRVATADAQSAFDVSSGPLFRGRLFRLNADEHAFLFVVHHLVFDGWSARVFFDELLGIYRSYAEGQGATPRDLPLQYPDYAVWQRASLERDELISQLAYWKVSLSGDLGRLNLPSDRPRPAVRSINGSRLKFSIPQPVADGLKELGRATEATMFMTMVAAFAALLHRYTGAEDVLIGTPSTNRDRREVEGLIGLFVNTLILRVKPTEETSFRTLLEDVRRLTLDAFANKDVPFERLVDELRPDRDLGRAPFFDVMFDYQKLDTFQHATGATLDDRERAENRTGELQTSFMELDSGTAKFEIGLSIRETRSGLSGDFEYNTDLFDRETIERMARHFSTLLESATRNADLPISRLTLSPANERQRLLTEFSTSRTIPLDTLPFTELVEIQAEQSPRTIAVRSGDEELTYAELNVRANRIAHFLLERGVEPDDRVAICVARSCEMVSAILGVLKAGAAYVPLDPAYPRDRLLQQVNEAGARIVLTDAVSAAELAIERGISAPVFIDFANAEIARMNAENPLRRAANDSLAYVIFTSGSTGTPIGAAVEHRSVSNLIQALRESIYDGLPQRGLRVSLNGSISFDTSVKQLVQLASGHTLEVIPDDLRWDGDAFLEFLHTRQVDVLDVTPSQLKLLVAAGMLNDQREYPGVLLIGGEAIDAELWSQLASHPKIRSFNLYGPTECTVDTTIREIHAGDQCPLLGRPIRNAEVFVLDGRLEPSPIGVPGELYIGGAGVGRGYLSREDLTTARFITSPFDDHSHLYRTGDKVRFRSSGELEFLGRVDRQIKLRGFRLEPGEIESVIKGYESVADAVVVAQGTGEHQRLVAYVKPETGCAPTAHGRERYALPNGLSVVHLNQNETDFLFDEVFQRLAYLRNGIVLKDDACVFDVGANIGLFTLFASFQSNRSRIFSFEPNPHLFELLAINASLYDADATVFNFGLSSSSRTASFTFYPGFSSLSGLYADRESDKEVVRSFIKREEEGAAAVRAKDNSAPQAVIEELLDDRFEHETFEVQLRTLSDVIAEHQVERIDLLKINVEKSELDVLKGIRSADWAKIDQIAVEVHDLEDRLATIVRMLHEHGYEVRVEQDWRLDASTKTNFYVYATRLGSTTDSHPRPMPPQRKVLTSSSLREYLSNRLPGYMIPTELTIVDAFPLTKNGKIDYRALERTPHQVAPPVERRLPTNASEQKLARIWSEVLRREDVGLDDNFFHIGGHSLLAAQLVGRVREAFGVKLPLKALFQLPTIAELAAFLSDMPSAIVIKELPAVSLVTPDPAHRYDPFPLTEIQEAYWIGRGAAFELGNVASHAYLEIENRGLDVELLNESWGRLISRHDMLRAVVLADGQQQVLRSVPEYQIAVNDLRGLDSVLQARGLAEVRDEMSHQVIPADRWPLFDIRASRLDNDIVRLHISLDALIADAMSIFTLFAEWKRFYLEPQLRLPSLELTFRDYVLARSAQRSENHEAAREYWLKRVGSLPPAPDLPVRASADLDETPRFTRRTARLDAARWRSLKTRAAEHGLTISAVLLRAYAEVINEWARKPHFTLNLTLFNRLPVHPDVNQIVGDFTSLNLLEVDCSLTGSFSDRARRIQSQLWQDLDHHEFSGISMMRALSQRSADRRPAAMPVVFTSALALDSLTEAATDLEWIGDLVYSVGQTPQVWLDHQVFELNSALVYNWDTVDGLFELDVIEGMFAAYTDLLHRLSEDEQIWTRPDLELFAGTGETRPERTKHQVPATTHLFTLEQFGGLLESVRALERDQFAILKYRYPSAGSLYPIQTYIKVPSGIVEGIETGNYYYHPLTHELVRIDTVSAVENVDQEVGSLEIILVSEQNAIRPMYGELARDFSLIETGYMSRLMTVTGRDHGIDLRAEILKNDEAIREDLLLDESQEPLYKLIATARAK